MVDTEVRLPTLMTQKSAKIDVLLKPVGNAPGMQKTKWKMLRTDTVLKLTNFIRSYIKLEAKESLFVYVVQSFAPPLDTEIGTLHDCFNADGTLILNYCKSPAWG